MRQAAIEQRRLLEEVARGVMRLFDNGGSEAAVAPPDKLFKHLPPVKPFWIPDDAD
jgi:hypothetical protein